jgi:hypothetical protein
MGVPNWEAVGGVQVVEKDSALAGNGICRISAGVSVRYLDKDVACYRTHLANRPEELLPIVILTPDAVE